MHPHIPIHIPEFLNSVAHCWLEWWEWAAHQICSWCCLHCLDSQPSSMYSHPIWVCAGTRGLAALQSGFVPWWLPRLEACNKSTYDCIVHMLFLHPLLKIFRASVQVSCAEPLGQMIMYALSLSGAGHHGHLVVEQNCHWAIFPWLKWLLEYIAAQCHMAKRVPVNISPLTLQKGPFLFPVFLKIWAAQIHLDCLSKLLHHPFGSHVAHPCAEGYIIPSSCGELAFLVLAWLLCQLWYQATLHEEES